MYQSDSFYIGGYSDEKEFSPKIINAFKILADNSYYHYCTEEEQIKYPQKTIAFIRCTEGEGEIHLQNDKLKISENECVFVKFNDIKEYSSVSNIWGYRWVNFDISDIGSAFRLNKIYNIPFSENEDMAFTKMLTLGKANLKNKSYINALFLNYFYSVMLENEIESKKNISNTNTKLIDEMCAYVHQKLYSKISIEEMSVFFKISPRRLHQIFISELSISPKKYMLKKKMEEGYKLLVQTSTPINKIADMLCFSSPYHFTNGFKKIFGQSPSEVRKLEEENDKADNKA